MILPGSNARILTAIDRPVLITSMSLELWWNAIKISIIDQLTKQDNNSGGNVTFKRHSVTRTKVRE